MHGRRIRLAMLQLFPAKGLASVSLLASVTPEMATGNENHSGHKITS